MNFAFAGVDPAIGGDPSRATTSQTENIREHAQTPNGLSGGLQPGDLVFYDGNRHVAIYLGDGLIVDAPQTFVDPTRSAGPHDYVRIEKLYEPGGSRLTVTTFARPNAFAEPSHSGQ